MLAIPVLPSSYSLDPGIPPSVGYRASVGYRGLSHGLLDDTGLGHGVAPPGCRAAQLAKLLRCTCSARPASRAISMGFPTSAFPRTPLDLPGAVAVLPWGRSSHRFMRLGRHAHFPVSGPSLPRRTIRPCSSTRDLATVTDSLLGL